MKSSVLLVFLCFRCFVWLPLKRPINICKERKGRSQSVTSETTSSWVVISHCFIRDSLKISVFDILCLLFETSLFKFITTNGFLRTVEVFLPELFGAEISYKMNLIYLQFSKRYRNLFYIILDILLWNFKKLYSLISALYCGCSLWFCQSIADSSGRFWASRVKV